MSLEIIEALRQEQLADTLCARLSEARGQRSPLESTTVVIQNTGLGRWLHLGLARRDGISAGLELPLARSYISAELHRVGLFNRFEALESVRMRWQVFELLVQREFVHWGEAAQPLLRYLAEQHPKLEQRCWQLAGQMADLYDQYAMYRPDWVLSWLAEAGTAHSAGDLPHGTWQIQLLRAVQLKMGYCAAQMAQRLLGLALHRYSSGAALRDPSASEVLPAIHVFGVSTFPPAFLGFFKRLASERDVTIYHLVCSEAYLGELPKSYRSALEAARDLGDELEPELGLVDNPLLIQSGQATARFQSLLLALDYPIGEMTAPCDDAACSDLDALQQALRGNQSQMGALRADGTLSIHSCHSPIREVQVLQQQLLALFAADPELRPEEILVLAPEIADYADAIEAVFGQAVTVAGEGQSYKIPYCIADRLAGHDEHCWRFFESLLGFLGGRQGFSELAALLDFDPVCAQLGVSREEMKELLVVLQDVGIRWGIDGISREQQGQPHFEAYSWSYGLQRLFEGLIFPDAGYETMAPYPLSRRMAEIIGELSQLLRRAFQLVRRLRETQSYQLWMNAVLEVVRDCVGSGERGDSWYSVILPALGHVKKAATETPISFETFCDVALGAKQEPSGPSGLLRRGVTFCRMQPVRHIPAKVLCVLGLNEGAYPRQPKRLEFDLIQQQRRLCAKGEQLGAAWTELEYLGDRRLRDEDRQLFLDCLLNARQRLYLSFVGQSDTDQKAHPPSLLVSELEQFLQLPSGSESREERAEKLNKLIVRHPLQEWSRSNFVDAQPTLGQPPVPLHFELTLAELRERVETPPRFLENIAAVSENTSSSDSEAGITVTRLIRFLKDPAEDFLKHQLQVNLNKLDWEHVFMDEEPLEAPDSLESWSLRDQVIADWLAAPDRLQGGFDAERYRQKMELSLRLPAGRAGVALWSNEVQPLLDYLEQTIGSAVLEKRESRRQVGDFCLMSEDWYDATGLRLILLNSSLFNKKKLSIKSALQIYLQHLCGGGVSRVLCLKDQSSYEISAGLPDVENWLQAVFQCWKSGQTKPLAFSLKIAQEFVEQCIQTPDADPYDLLGQAHAKQWEVNAAFGQFGDDTPAQRMCFDGDSPAAPGAEWNAAFIANASCLLGPVIDWADALKGGAR